MAKDPAQRYATPERAAQALSLFVRNTPPVRAAATPLPAFVQWLEKEAPGEPAKPPATSAVGSGIPVGKLERSGRKPEPARPPEPRKPAAAAAPAPPTVEFDVELVPIPEPASSKRKRDDEPRGLMELNRRDALMLCSGGGLVVAAIAAGWGLYRLLRREPPPEPTPPATPPTEPQAPPEG
jgi:hypothetical protein